MFFYCSNLEMAEELISLGAQEVTRIEMNSEPMIILEKVDEKLERVQQLMVKFEGAFAFSNRLHF